MQATITIIEQFNRRMGQAVSWLALLMVLMTCYNVVSRYFFAAGMPWQQEIVRFAHAILFLLAAAYTLVEDKHVRIDVCYQKFTAKQRAWVDLVGAVLLLIPVGISILYFSWDYMQHSWQLYEASNEYGGMPGVFLLKTTIGVFAASLLLQALSMVLRCVQVIRHGGTHG